jgi:hypothetical protein
VEVDALFGSVYVKLKIITCLVLLDYSSIFFQAFSLVRDMLTSFFCVV